MSDLRCDLRMECVESDLTKWRAFLQSYGLDLEKLSESRGLVRHRLCDAEKRRGHRGIEGDGYGDVIVQFHDDGSFDGFELWGS